MRAFAVFALPRGHRDLGTWPQPVATACGARWRDDPECGPMLAAWQVCPVGRSKRDYKARVPETGPAVPRPLHELYVVLPGGPMIPYDDLVERAAMREG